MILPLIICQGITGTLDLLIRVKGPDLEGSWEVSFSRFVFVPVVHPHAGAQ